jgi:curved DNA-binding protein CbpA
MPRDPDLYRRLGLERGVGEADLHRAYRRAAKSAHPDAGGDPEKWGALCEAYDVLRDARRRRVYEDTGAIEGAAPDTHQAALLMRLATVMDQIAQQAAQRGQPLGQIDWLRSIEATIRAEIGTIRQGIPQLRSRADGWNGVAARTHADPGRVNVLGALARGKAEECRRRVGQAEQEVAQREEALTLLAGQRFDAEPVAGMGFQQHPLAAVLGRSQQGGMW